MKTGNLSFTVVIPTKNRWKDLHKAIDSVLQQSYKPNEIIIINQSDKDDAKDKIYRMINGIRDTKLTYIYKPNLSGLTAAKNTAIKVAESDILIFIDDDIVLNREFIEVISSVYKEHSDIDGVGGVVTLPFGESCYLKRQMSVIFQIGPFGDSRALIQAGYFRNRKIVPTWLLSGGLSSLRRRVFEEVLFNENLEGASPIEDMDFYSRCKGRFNFCIAVRAKALHNISSASRQDLHRIYREKLSGFFYIYRICIEHTLKNRLAFMWRIFGMIIDALVSCFVNRSVQPLKGLFIALYVNLRAK